MSEDRRLIEVAFPLKQVSLDSTHEKNVRPGHISTLHIWPARRPLAASRAVLIATLLSDPGTPEKRKAILERMAGRVIDKVEYKRLGERTIEKKKEVTAGGILHWKKENDPDLEWFRKELEWFRKEIQKAYGNRAPKVLDPFAGGGAIPLEAMRMGCEVTATDINPVAWFILKCTLDYPRRLAGAPILLPEFALKNREFMETFLEAKGLKGAGLRTYLERLGHGSQGRTHDSIFPHTDELLKADLAWHIGAWGRWLITRVRKELSVYYPTYAEYESLVPGREYEPRPKRMVEVDQEGCPQVDTLNTEFSEAYLREPSNPRYVAKPPIAYLWARTVLCKQCRAEMPLLKTQWLCKKKQKRVLLTMKPNNEKTGVVFGVQTDVPHNGGNPAQRRENNKRIGAGTMSRSGARCPCCEAIMTMEDIRLEGRAGRLNAFITVVVVAEAKDKEKEYRLPTDHERAVVQITEERLQELYKDIPFGLPGENLPGKEAPGVRLPLYGIDKWRKLFTSRQLVTQSVLLRAITETRSALDNLYSPDVADAITAFLACIMERQVDYGSMGCIWVNSMEGIGHQFSRFALPMIWDIAEVCPLATSSGSLESALGWITKVVDHLQVATQGAPAPQVNLKSAISQGDSCYDLIITDPPYYDAIPYSDLMDFFYIWLRRFAYSASSELEPAFKSPLGPKWDAKEEDGELIDDASRFGGNKERSKQNYEDGMARAFKACLGALQPNGRLVVVFASKNPAAWETLVAALIRAGFVVTASWPIQTERQTRMRANNSAALASSVWLVCKKRPENKPGWDKKVLHEMRENITQQLRDFWDAGIRGPDFVWAATGPAMEAFSKHPVVKKADQPGKVLTVSNFLREVRRMVVDFIVGRVLTKKGGPEAVTELDDITTYYLLHRHSFGMREAPIGGCILYALSCNLSDSSLVTQHDLLLQSRKKGIVDDKSKDDDIAEEEDSGSIGARIELKPWNLRQRKNLGLKAPDQRPIPLIDQVHKLMQLWCTKDQVKVNDYLDKNNLWQNGLFHQILQALIELADAGSEERSLLESLSKHAAEKGELGTSRQREMVWETGKQ